MPQLPPVAAAAFLLCLLTVILTTTAVVQVRSRQRRMRLARMAAAAAEISRPSVPPGPPLRPATRAAVALPPRLRGHSYDAAARQSSFRAFEERPVRPPAPGRPARRLAAQLARLAPITVDSVVLESMSPPPAAETDGGGVVETVPPSPPGERAAVNPGVEGERPFERDSEAAMSEIPPVPDVSQVLVTAAQAGNPELAPGGSEPIEAPPIGGPEGDLEPPSLLATPAPEEAGELASVGPPHLPGMAVWEPQITVLPPASDSPALPALMTREVTLGDATRALRSVFPGGLTMTDGQRLRRAVAIGAATSVVAAAFVIRGRRR